MDCSGVRKKFFHPTKHEKTKDGEVPKILSAVHPEKLKVEKTKFSKPKLSAYKLVCK
jgi:hypothetical protein